MKEGEFTVEVGILLCRYIRDMLEDEIFNGRKIRYRESKGWLSRTFEVRGDAQDIMAVGQRVDYYITCLNQY